MHRVILCIFAFFGFSLGAWFSGLYHADTVSALAVCEADKAELIDTALYVTDECDKCQHEQQLAADAKKIADELAAVDDSGARIISKMESFVCATEVAIWVGRIEGAAGLEPGTMKKIATFVKNGLEGKYPMSILQQRALLRALTSNPRPTCDQTLE